MGGPKPGEFARGTESVDTNMTKLKRDADEFFNMFCVNFVNSLAKSPAAALAYLEEKQKQTQRAWLNMKYKFESARKIQKEVESRLTEAIDDLYRIKTAAELGLAIVGAFVPIWWVPLGVGLLYVLITETAKTSAEVGRSDVGVLKKAVAKTVVVSNAASQGFVAGMQKNADKEAEDAAKLLEHAESVSKKVEADCRRKMDKLAEKGGEELNRATRKQIGRQLEKIAAEKEAARLAKLNSGLGDAAKQGCRVGGICVALIFMKDDIIKAWNGYTATERQELLKKSKEELQKE
jgi:hypothetical protein